MTITGERGEVRWGYNVAVVLAPWSVQTNEGGQRVLSGTVASADTFRVSQRPLVFVSPNGWQWPITELQIAGASLSAVLGPKELSHGKVHPAAGHAAPAHSG